MFVTQNGNRTGKEVLMPSLKGKSLNTVTSEVRNPLSSTRTEQANEGTLSRGERLAMTLMVMMICLLLGVAVFKDIHKRDIQGAYWVEVYCREVLSAAPAAYYFVMDGAFDRSFHAEAEAHVQRLCSHNAMRYIKIQTHEQH
jgi:hypothetical protein